MLLILLNGYHFQIQRFVHKVRSLNLLRLKLPIPSPVLKSPFPYRTQLSNFSSPSPRTLHHLYLSLALVCVPGGGGNATKAIVHIHRIIVLRFRTVFFRMHVEKRFPRFFLIVVMPCKVIALGADSVIAIPSRIRAYFVRPEWVTNGRYCFKSQGVSVR